MAFTEKKWLWLAAAGGAAWWFRRAVVQHRRCDFAGKTVLITGGSRGLGLVLARQWVDEQARVAICARNGDELQAAVRELTARGGEVLGIECDVTDRADVESCVRKVHEQWGAIDILVNNAGRIQVGPLAEMTLEDYEQAMDVHFRGPLLMTLAVLEPMRQRRQGRIVNIASIGGIVSVPHLLPYSASKFALVGLSQGLRSELLKDGIYVTTVCPGLMRTGSPVHAQFKGQHQAEHAWFSVSASAPLITITAEQAAAEILRACRNGRAHLVLSLPAKAAALIQGVAPGTTAEVMGVVNRLLPAPGGIGTEQRPGRASRAPWLPAWMTALGDQAARRNNELQQPEDFATH